MHIDWRAAVSYVAEQAHWKQRVAVGGLLILVLPPLGWLLALGYRSLVGHRMLDGASPLLPPWRGNFAVMVRRGAASSGVILGYLTPFFAGYWLLGMRNAGAAVDHWRELAMFAGGAIALPPLAIPTLPLLYAARYDWLDFSRAEIALLLMLFFGAIAVLPAAFLQVAHRRRFGAAFNVVAAVRVVTAAPRLYVEAWIVSLAVSAASVLLLPLAPWLLFWSYLVISHLFLQILVSTRPAPRAAPLAYS